MWNSAKRRALKQRKDMFQTKYAKTFLVFAYFLNHRKFLKQSEIVYNGLEIKNDMAKERMVDSP